MTFDEFKAIATKKSIASIIGLIAGILISAILWLFSDIPPAILKLLEFLPNTGLKKLLLGLLVVCLSEGVWIYSRRTKLKPGFGVLWDRKLNPYCPSCKNLLTNYTNWSHTSPQHYAWGFWCVKCQQKVFLNTDDGASISLEDAKEQLRK